MCFYFTHSFLNRCNFHLDGPLFATPTAHPLKFAQLGLKLQIIRNKQPKTCILPSIMKATVDFSQHLPLFGTKRGTFVLLRFEQDSFKLNFH